MGATGFAAERVAPMGRSYKGGRSGGIALSSHAAIRCSSQYDRRPRGPSAMKPTCPPRRVSSSEIGRASCRGRVCPHVYISVVAVSLKQKKIRKKKEIKR